MSHVQLAFMRAWVASRLDDRDDAGLTSVEWMFLVVGVLVIAGIAIAAVTTFVTNQGNKLNSGQ